MNRTLRLKSTVPFLLLFAAFDLSQAQTLTTLVDFDGSNGAYPELVSLAQGRDGNFYGTTLTRGPNGNGTVFSVTTDGQLTTGYGFCSKRNCVDGEGPSAGMVLSTQESFYGTTSGGGANSQGTIFQITPGGSLTTLHSFDGSDGRLPVSGVIQATDGRFYGTTTYGGARDMGTIFKMTLAGRVSILHTFRGPDGAYPSGTLIEASSGELYGTTNGGGTHGFGTIFKIDAHGEFSSLYSFGHRLEGAFPTAGLVEGNDGFFYGITEYGGKYDDGTIFKVTQSGIVTILHSFDFFDDGAQPVARLVQATDEDFYGITTTGGSNQQGTIFKIAPSGSFSNVYNFNGNDGSGSQSGLLQGTNGLLYGTTATGGSNNFGTVFSLDMGLGPFVTFIRGSGKIGRTGAILGQGFIGATHVSLNGTPVGFTVVSDTCISATIPPGAATGYVTVTTLSGTLTSNKPFIVLP